MLVVQFWVILSVNVIEKGMTSLFFVYCLDKCLVSSMLCYLREKNKEVKCGATHSPVISVKHCASHCQPWQRHLGELIIFLKSSHLMQGSSDTKTQRVAECEGIWENRNIIREQEQ